jgi:hypothetical protein
MKLSVHERLMLGNILPQEGDFVTLKVLRNLRMDLSFSDTEIKKWSIQSSNGQVNWRLFNDKNKPIDQEAEIEIGHKQKDIIVNALSKLNEQKKLREEHLTLYERFIGE